jgi:hypothetical protein
MIARTMTRSTTIRVAYVKERKGASLFVAISLVIACLAVIPVFSVLTGACEDAKADLIEKLKREKEVSELNKTLKIELVAITQKGYVEFAAQERLGLKRPNDAEVVVLR